jgi:hypothetical protein
VISVVEGEFRPATSSSDCIYDHDHVHKSIVLEMIKDLVNFGSDIHVENPLTKKNLLYTVVDGRNDHTSNEMFAIYNYIISLFLSRKISIVSSTGHNALSITHSYTLAKKFINAYEKCGRSKYERPFWKNSTLLSIGVSQFHRRKNSGKHKINHYTFKNEWSKNVNLP